MEDSKKIIYNYACAVLARRRLTVHEIRQKMYKRFPDFPMESEEIIKKFLELRYLNDDEYVQLYTKDQLMRKPQGLRSIKQKLKLKGISKELIEKNLIEEEIDELKLAKTALAKKLKTLRSKSPLQQKQKCFRFLASRGFNQDTIYLALKSAGHASDAQEAYQSPESL